MQSYNPEQALLKARREFGEHGGVVPSIERSSTFTVMHPDTMPEIFTGIKGPEQGGCFLYSRHFNPTVDVLSRYLAAMEGTQAAVCTASGMSAISCAVLQLCSSGDHIVASKTIYGGTHALFESLLPQMKINTTFVNIADLDAVKAAITPETRVIFTETMGNPTLNIADLPALSAIARSRNIKLMVDNTFSPMIFTPHSLGADVVIYSLTKYINGASDLVAGAICGDKQFVSELMGLHTGRVMLLGPTMDPRVAFDIIQRLPHLAIRMREHSRRGLAIAGMLKGMGVRVSYPGLLDHPQHALAAQMCNQGFGFGGILAMDCGDRSTAEKMMEILQNEEKFGLIAVSLGYFDTLISCSGSSTSSEITAEDQQEMGLSPGLLRIALGYTGSLDDRMGQIKRAVEKVLGKDLTPPKE
ncbi:MAG: aminotransferase class I/II-fold pyridoxal phosphate-dependent enzyme [Proteobacteria bacterium]|nr:aminotransferase class I/II-fold pyridoxal phosphate-dependent enzyme [Desulfobacula sp.]MBU3952101.1 aminotransferase class I/II-fold pyridoxal phosphate-dependent enzyme [Pseudomonadota bacterium]MBU4131051.1 aminotransferase class I/II-fold pyridoxal phosphate-dependent enzyme [Pseudomonadota bacterium]